MTSKHTDNKQQFDVNSSDNSDNTDINDINESRDNSDHIVPFGKFHRIWGAPPDTFPDVKYDVPEEMGGDRKCFTVLLGN